VNAAEAVTAAMNGSARQAEVVAAIRAPREQPVPVTRVSICDGNDSSRDVIYKKSTSHHQVLAYNELLIQN
jgi:hypothetical protein